jgi:hypothetical protein
MPLNELQVIGSLALVLTIGVILIARFQREWSRASAEDEAFALTRDDIRDCVEIAGIDTRLLRPWGDSAATERFVMSARAAGHGWLEAAVAPLHVEVPIAIRAVAGEVDRTKVAFLVARTRRMGTIAKALAHGPAGIVEEVEELGPDDVRPLLALRIQLGRLASRAKVPA